MMYSVQFDVPSYNTWLLHEADVSSAYRWHRRYLQHLQHAVKGQWLLKSPAHLWHLDALAAEYPDAIVVQTHRDPLRVISSGRELTPDTEQRMRDFLVAHPGDGGGGRYRWADTGLDADELRERVAAYQERYDVPSEPLT
jgi:hypothetical protein